jgi:hypothetical protein
MRVSHSFSCALLACLTFACSDRGPAGEGEGTLAELGQELASGRGFSSTRWHFPSKKEGDEFGEFVGGVGDINDDGLDDVVLASYFYGDDVGLNNGAVMWLKGSKSGVPASASQLLESPDYPYWAKVARLGDVNGDGYDDAVFEGLNGDRADLYLGGKSGFVTTRAWSLPYVRVFGGVGDVNHDGLNDVLISNRVDDVGHLRIFPGTPDGLGAEPIWHIDSQTGPIPGWSSAALAGDVNGDGFADLIVGDGSCHVTGGRLYLFLGTAQGLSTTPSQYRKEAYPCSGLGLRVAAPGDVNGDGYADVLAARQEDAESLLYVYFGEPAGLRAEPWIGHLNYDDGDPFYTSSIAGLGDASGDGFADFAAGAWYYLNSTWDRGRALAYMGSSGTMRTTESWRVYESNYDNNDVDGTFGGALAAAGDVNGDGLGDLVVGDTGYDSKAGFDDGAAYVYFGGGDAPAPDQKIVWNIAAHDSGGSEPIAPGGRLESASGFDVHAMARGAYGRIRVRLQAEVKPSATAFDGTGLLETSEWQDSGVSGTEIVLPVTGLTSNTAYKFRVRLLYDEAYLTATSRSRWFTGEELTTACDDGDADLDDDGVCDVEDADDDQDGTDDVADCAPTDAAVHPSAEDIADDGIDQDCSGADSKTCQVDADHDGYGTTETLVSASGSCSETGLSPNSGDCDDLLSPIHPGAEDVADDGIDQDCDGEDAVVLEPPTGAGGATDGPTPGDDGGAASEGGNSSTAGGSGPTDAGGSANGGAGAKTPDEDAGGSGGSSGSGAGSSASAGAPPAANASAKDHSGCSCRLPTRSKESAASWIGVLLLACAFTRRAARSCTTPR